MEGIVRNVGMAFVMGGVFCLIATGTVKVYEFYGASVPVWLVPAVQLVLLSGVAAIVLGTIMCMGARKLCPSETRGGA